MKQFLTILSFELKAYFKNKIFIGVTILLLVVTAGVMFFPKFHQVMGSSDDTETSILLVDAPGLDVEPSVLQQEFASAFPGYQVQVTDADENEIREKIDHGEAECAFLIDSPVSYNYYVRNLSMHDINTQIADEMLQKVYYMTALTDSGLTQDQARTILTTQVFHKTISLEKDQSTTFLYTYLMVFALYLVIMLYGQMVATSVATEKSSRAMELLITSAKPTAMMFGKVIAACLAGLFQIVLVFGSSILFYSMNREDWAGNELITSMFSMPVDIFLYMLLFFILGFFLYAFLYGAIGSMASKVEDINTSSMPLTLLFVFSFMVVIFSVVDGTTDSLLLNVCSYLPFTSSMAMFTRISMGTVPFYEILISVAILIFSVIGVGVLSARIYRVGVLLYGTTPKPGTIFQAIRKK